MFGALWLAKQAVTWRLPDPPTMQEQYEVRTWGHLLPDVPAEATATPMPLVVAPTWEPQYGDISEPLPNAPRYTVQGGDTLYSIARRFNTTVEDLVRANDLNGNLIHTGNELFIPMPQDLSFIQIEQGVVHPYSNPAPEQVSVQIEASNTQNFETMKGIADQLSKNWNYKAEEQWVNLMYSGVYFKPGEFNSMPSNLVGYSHLYGINYGAEGLNPHTSSGAIFNPNMIACASWFYPLHSIIRVQDLDTGRSILCYVNDHGPDRNFFPEIDVVNDMTIGAARLLDPNAGVGPGQKGRFRVKITPVHVPEGFREQMGAR